MVQNGSVLAEKRQFYWGKERAHNMSELRNRAFQQRLETLDTSHITPQRLPFIHNRNRSILVLKWRKSEHFWLRKGIFTGNKSVQTTQRHDYTTLTTQHSKRAATARTGEQNALTIWYIHTHAHTHAHTSTHRSAATQGTHGWRVPQHPSSTTLKMSSHHHWVAQRDKWYMNKHIVLQRAPGIKKTGGEKEEHKSNILNMHHTTFQTQQWLLQKQRKRHQNIGDHAPHPRDARQGQQHLWETRGGREKDVRITTATVGKGKHGNKKESKQDPRRTKMSGLMPPIQGCTWI